VWLDGKMTHICWSGCLWFNAHPVWQSIKDFGGLLRLFQFLMWCLFTNVKDSDNSIIIIQKIDNWWWWWWWHQEILSFTVTNCSGPDIAGMNMVLTDTEAITQHNRHRSKVINACVLDNCICVFIFYFISIVYYVISQLSACTSDTCILKDQSINQSINLSSTVSSKSCFQSTSQ